AVWPRCGERTTRLGGECPLDRLGGDVRRDVLYRAGGCGVPLELQGFVDIGKAGADRVAAADEDDGCEERGTTDDALAASDDLDAVDAHAVRARAVLAGQLADPRVEAERLQRRDDPVGAVPEAVLDAGRHVVVRGDLLEHHRALVVDHGVAADGAQQRLEAVVARRLLRGGVTGAQAVEAAERRRGARAEHAPRARDQVRVAAFCFASFLFGRSVIVPSAASAANAI